MFGVACGGGAPGDSVMTLRIPAGGRMPRAVVDAEGTVHVVYVRGSMSSANLFYAKRGSGDSAWSQPERVNSQQFSVYGTGPVDGGQLAMGPDSRLHVVWFQTDPVRFFYARSTLDGSGFEPQRDLLPHEEGGVEAGPTVATDEAGNVFVFWHAGAVEDAHRAVYLTVSRDGGTTFEPARRVSAEAEGACGCCSLAATSDSTGAIYVSYRGAGDNVRRGQRLLTSTDHGRTFADQLIHPWELGACPVSTTSLFRGPDRITVAWETEGQVYFADVDQLFDAIVPAGSARYRRKNPVLAVNPRGDTLLAWGDGRGLRSGGTLHWQVFGADGRPTREAAGGTEMIPSGSIPAVVARSDGSFLVIF